MVLGRPLAASGTSIQSLRRPREVAEKACSEAFSVLPGRFASAGLRLSRRHRFRSVDFRYVDCVIRSI
jgi:hypothetical protein